MRCAAQAARRRVGAPKMGVLALQCGQRKCDMFCRRPRICGGGGVRMGGGKRGRGGEDKEEERKEGGGGDEDLRGRRLGGTWRCL